MTSPVSPTPKDTEAEDGLARILARCDQVDPDRSREHQALLSPYIVRLLAGRNAWPRPADCTGALGWGCCGGRRVGLCECGHGFRASHTRKGCDQCDCTEPNPAPAAPADWIQA